MEDYKIQVGNRLKYLRKSRNIPITLIIDKLNIARPTYTGWELGHRSPRGEKLVQLASIFNTTTDFITGKTNDEEQPDQNLLKEALEKASIESAGKPLSPEKREALVEVIMKLLKD